MSPKVLSLGVLLLCIAQVGCAASNGGGLVVGNPLVSESSVQGSKTKTPSCDCAKSKDPKVKANCKCATSTSTNTSTAPKVLK